MSPTVSLLLFTYNHEKYIEEAITSALSQNYNPLEIVVCDDCSTDSTYLKSVDILKSYFGKHDLRIIRNTKNLGLPQNINNSVHAAKGDFIIMASGDDISKPERVSKIMDIFKSDSSIKAVFSDMETIDEDGKIHQSKIESWNPFLPVNLSEIAKGGGGVGHGASYAYHRSCFYWPSPIPERFIAEDRLLPFRAAILGKVAYLNERLVKYRILSSSLSRSTEESALNPVLNETNYSELLENLKAAESAKLLSKKEAENIQRLLRRSRNRALTLKLTKIYAPRLHALINFLTWNLLHSDTLFKRIHIKIDKHNKN